MDTYKFKISEDWTRLEATDPQGFTSLVAVIPSGCVLEPVMMRALVEQANREESDAMPEEYRSKLGSLKDSIDEIRNRLNDAYKEMEKAEDYADSASAHASEAKDIVTEVNESAEEVGDKVDKILGEEA